MNGQYWQVGPPSQSSQAGTQLVCDTVSDWQAGTANNSCQHRMSNTGVRPPQSAHFTYRDGACSKRQMSDWQSSSVCQQGLCSQQPAGGESHNYYPKVLQDNLQNSFTNMQSGNLHLLVNNGLQVAAQQDCHPTSGFINSSTQILPNMMKANTTYPQQDMSAHLNQRGIVHGKQLARMQDGNVMSVFQQFRGLQNGESTKPISAYTTTTTSVPREQVVCTNSLVSATAHNRQTAHNQNHRQNGTQHGFSPSIPAPSYNMAISQAVRNNSITTNPSSSGHILHVASMSQKTQQYQIHPNSTHNNREEATHHFLSKANEIPLNPAADTQEQMFRRQMTASIANDLRQSFIVSSDGCPPVHNSSPYRGKQFVSKVRMMQSIQNMQPVTLTESYNSNASRCLPLNSGLSLSKTSDNMSRTQYSEDAPQQSSIPNVFYVMATGDASGNGNKAVNAFFPKSNRVSKGNQVGSVSDASQLMKLPETISPQKNETESSIYSSPGCTGTRAVAIVQPLSQESNHVASKQTSSNTTATDESLSSPKKLFISPAVEINNRAPYLREGSNLYQENQSQMRSNKSVDSTFELSYDSAQHQDLSQKQLCADGTGSELAINMQVDQCAAPAAQQSVTSEVPVSPSGDKDKSENITDPKARVCELSSVPSIPWTVVRLGSLIVTAEKAQMDFRSNPTMFDSARKLLSMFWDGNCKTLISKLKAGWYNDLITDVTEFCRKRVKSDSVILSQVTYSFVKKLKNYYVLKDNSVYSEMPYKSSWLNVNEQLDDIDKEFGFPWSWKHDLHMLESHSQPDQGVTVNSIPSPIVSEVPNKVLSQIELEPVDSGEEKQASTVETTSTQAASPNETESANSSDPYYSFEIHVLPPEEARVIFEQVQSKMPQSIDTDNQPERVVNSSVESELLEAIDVTLNDSKLENKSACPIEQVCCISKWTEIICGSSTPSLSKCQCKDEQSLKDCTDKTLDKEEMTEQKKDNLCAIMSDSKFPTEGQNQAKGDKNINFKSQSELCSELSETLALTENDCKSHSYSDKEPKNKEQSSLILINENEDLSSGDTEIQLNQEVDCIQGQFKSTESTQSCTSVSSDKGIQNRPSSESEVASWMSDLQQICGQAQLTSTDVEESSLETEEEQTRISATAALQTTFSPSGKRKTVERKRKRLSSHDRFFPFLKKSNKYKPPVDVDSQPSPCRKVLTNGSDSESLASAIRTVQLVLFGSGPQDKGVLIGNRKRPISTPGTEMSDGVPRPPDVLSVNLSPLRRRSSETILMRECSVKNWIHEKLRSFPPTKIRRRSKLKTQKCTVASLSGMSLKKAETVRPTTTVALKQPADQERTNAENGSPAVMPIQENNVLSFSVLPSTFNFKDESNKRWKTSDTVPNKSAVVEGKGKSPNKTVTREKGTWYSNPEKDHCPLHLSTVPKTSGIFHVFQKKYMEMTQPSMDE